MSRRKLIFISNLFPDAAQSYRGLDNAIILHGLREHFDIRVLSPRPALRPQRFSARTEDAPLRPEYLTVPYIPKVGSRWNHLFMAGKLKSRLTQMHRAEPADLILCSWLYPDACAVVRCAAPLGLPVTMITQGTDTHTYLASPVRRQLILQAIATGRRVICRSDDLRRRLAAAGADSAKLCTIYNGIDPHLFCLRDQSTARAALSLPEDASLFLFVGNLRPVKNPLMLVAAFAEVRQSHPNCDLRLLLIGQGEMRGEILSCAESLGVGSSVQLLGPKTSAEIAEYMAAANALCISSRLEGLPNVLLESLASGLPVVSTHVGGISELLHDGKQGWLVNEGDASGFAAAMSRLLESSPSRAEIASYGSQFSWSRTIQTYADVLNETSALANPPLHP